MVHNFETGPETIFYRRSYEGGATYTYRFDIFPNGTTWKAVCLSHSFDTYGVEFDGHDREAVSYNDIRQSITDHMSACNAKRLHQRPF
jgi:hypothetical protein